LSLPENDAFAGKERQGRRHKGFYKSNLRITDEEGYSQKHLRRTGKENNRKSLQCPKQDFVTLNAVKHLCLNNKAFLNYLHFFGHSEGTK